MSKSNNPLSSIFYTYVYLDPRKSGDYIYQRGIEEVYCFNHELIYTGKGSNDRINDHIKDALNSDTNKLFYNVIRKIYEAGLEPIRIKILQNVTEEEAFAEEITLISIAGRRDLGKGPLCNLTDGGEGCSGYKHTKETRKILSEKLKGRDSPNKGKKFSPEFCDKASKSATERFENPKEREKMSIVAYERWGDEEKEKQRQRKINFYQTDEGMELRIRISEFQKARKDYNVTEKQKEQISVGNKKCWKDRKAELLDKQKEIIDVLENHPSFIKTRHGNFLSIDRKIQYMVKGISLRKNIRKHPKDKWDREWTAHYKDIEIIDGNFIPSKNHYVYK